MKKTFKGFTLIECIVSLAILGIAALTMAQIYAGVAMRNRRNHELNSSMANQTAYIEKQIKDDSGAVSVFKYQNTDDPDTNTTPPHSHLSQNKVTDSYILIKDQNGNEYSYPVDVYLLKSRDKQNRDDEDAGYNGAADDETDLRYKFFTAH